MNATRRRRYDPAPAETSVWDVYNNVADIRDDELIKDWNDSLNFLLVFAAIFAAVLTALIVESMRLLREDPQETTNALLFQISNQLANTTIPAYHTIPFIVPTYAVIVNAFLFASICCSLVAALAAVLALQWVNEYDARIETVDAKKRALIRHFRFLGVKTWKMGEIIAMLPLLLHASVFLFFAGIVVWMYNLHLVMYYICVGGAAVAVVPMARGFRYAIFKSTGQFMRLVYNLEFAFWVNSFLQERWYTPPRWLHGRLYTLWSSLDARRDARALEEKETREEFLEETMVTWTACHVELGSQSTDRLVHILKGATPLFVEKTMEGPWDEIMDHISGSCLKRAESQLLCAEDHARVHVILAAAMTEFFRRKPSFDRALDHGTWDRWECTLKLTGPFLLLDDLGQAEMEAFVSILQSRCSKNSKSSAAQLVAATRSLGPASTEQEKWIIAYAIYNLCIYIWVNEYNRSHRQVVDRLVEMIDIPHQTLPVATPYEMCLPLALSALYSVAFGKPERERHFWASAHPLYPAGRTDERLGAVQALHCAITNRIAATACQEQSLEMVQIHLKHLCRLLAYAPCIADDSKEVNRCIEIMEKLPHRFDNCHHLTHESSFTALPSIIWVHRASKIPRIHEYLEVFLSCQRRFPTLKPVWRSWHDIHASGHGNRLFSLFGHDKKWLDHFINDRRLTELLHAFDQLIEAGCSIDQHVVIVQLAIHDLSDNRGAHYHDYYTAARKMELQRLQDPALRLIGARAANMAYSGAIPHEDAPEWSSEPWIEAVRFWCEAYQKTDVTSDEALLQATLLQSNDVLHSAVMEASFDNKLLQDRIRALLISTLDKCTDANTVLLLHVAAQTSSWFPDYLTEARVGKLVGILSTARPLSMRVLPVLATLLSPIHDPSQLIAILASAQRVLTENSHYPGQNEVCELAASIEQTMHCPPQWIQSYKTTDEKTWRRIWDSLNETACTLQEQENFSRTFIRWNGGSHSRQRYRRRSTFNSGLEMGLETLHQEDALRDSSSLNRFQQPGLGTRLLGLLHRPDRGENHEGDSSYMGDAQMSNLALSGQRNPFVIDDDWESIQLAEGSNDRRYSCSAAWDI